MHDREPRRLTRIICTATYSSLILRAQADVLATSIYAYELDDERTSVKLTIEGDDTVLFEKDFEPSSGTVV